MYKIILDYIRYIRYTIILMGVSQLSIDYRLPENWQPASFSLKLLAQSMTILVPRFIEGSKVHMGRAWLCCRT